jgi:tetratricopeptide repeat protein
MGILALILGAQGDQVAARRLQERVLELTTRVLGEEHPSTLISMNNLAATLYTQGDHVGARQFQERLLEASKRAAAVHVPVSGKLFADVALVGGSVQLDQKSIRIPELERFFRPAGLDLQIARL